MICKKHNEERKVLKNGRTMCASCNREAQNLWWNKNKEKQQQRVKNNRNRIKDIILEFKKNQSCIICGEDNPLVLEFDHIRDKKYDVSSMARVGFTKEKIEEEIAKCQILCSNCHQIKTHIDNNSYTFQKLESDPRFTDKFLRVKRLNEVNNT